MTFPQVGILGAGSLGAIIGRGLVRAGWPVERVTFVARRKERAEELESETGIRTVTDLVEGCSGAEVVVIAVKPRDIRNVTEAIAPHLDPDQVVVSLAAGVEIASIQAALPDSPVVRAMPNTPAAVDLGITALAPGDSVDQRQLDAARQVFDAVGDTIELQEDLFDAVTAVSGTGPAYVFLLAEALIEAAIREGLPHHAAERLVHQTMQGAGTLLAVSGKSAFRLRGQVTSPGGTTAAAMHVLEEGGFRALMEDAVRAAARRSAALGEGQSPE